MYGILIASTTFVSVLFAEKIIKQKKLISLDDYWNIILIIIPAAVIGGRLYHVLDQWDYYSLNLSHIFQLWRGGMGIFGSIVFGIAAVYFYSRYKKQNFFIYSDLILFFAPLVQIAGRFGNYFNYELFGKPTNAPFGVFIPSQYRPSDFLNYTHFHPLFFYEIIFSALVFSYFVMFYFYRDTKFGEGKITGIFFTVYGLIRIVLEPLRLPSDTFTFYGIGISYLLSTLLLISGILILIKGKIFTNHS